MEHSQLVVRFFGPANEQMSKLVEPGMGALHHLAASFVPGFLGLHYFPARADMGRVAQTHYNFTHLGVVVTHA